MRVAKRKDNSRELDAIADGVAPPKKRKPKAPAAPLSLRVPAPDTGVKHWLVLGLDPSLSRTGYAFQLVDATRQVLFTRWLEVGSLKPEDSAIPVWIRSKAIALHLRDMLREVTDRLCEELASGITPAVLLREVGLIVSLEAPTPGNDFLISISRILHLILLDKANLPPFGRVQVQLTNASTLRSLMGLVQRGNKNKKENVAKAYTFLDEARYPNLDTDACDAVLMAMMGRHSAAILLDCPSALPEKYLIALCNGAQEVVGKGRNQRTRTKGILHRPEYWSQWQQAQHSVLIRNAKTKQARLDRATFAI